MGILSDIMDQITYGGETPEHIKGIKARNKADTIQAEQEQGMIGLRNLAERARLREQIARSDANRGLTPQRKNLESETMDTKSGALKVEQYKNQLGQLYGQEAIDIYDSDAATRKVQLDEVKKKDLKTATILEKAYEEMDQEDVLSRISNAFQYFSGQKAVAKFKDMYRKYTAKNPNATKEDKYKFIAGRLKDAGFQETPNIENL